MTPRTTLQTARPRGRATAPNALRDEAWRVLSSIVGLPRIPAETRRQFRQMTTGELAACAKVSLLAQECALERLGAARRRGTAPRRRRS